nr:unnamed protein product [Naegleria fowleri]
MDPAEESSVSTPLSCFQEFKSDLARHFETTSKELETTGHGSLISGVPKDQISRTVRIYRPSKSATQQGISKTLKWRVEWKKQSAHGEVWHDPMMGWNATNDPLMTTYMYFNSLEDAIDYCKSQGFEYEIEDPESKKSSEPEGKSYASKFKYRKEEEDW